MQRFTNSNRRISALVLLFLSILSFVTALPQNHDEASNLAARGGAKPDYEEENLPTITEEQYIAYLEKYFPDTDKYLLYTGGSEDQLKEFQKQNPDYKYYPDFFDNKKTPHYDEAFDSTKVQDDGDASSRAIAKVATKIHVFGAAEYQTLGSTRFFATDEIPRIKDNIKAGKVPCINHMAKGATKIDQIMATEDADGKFTYKPGFSKDTTNSSLSPCKRKRDGAACLASTCAANEAKIGPDGECRPCPGKKIPVADGKKCGTPGTPKPKPTDDNDKDKDKKISRTKWCLGFVAGSGFIGGAESLRTDEGVKTLEDAATSAPTDTSLKFDNLDYVLTDSNLNIDVDKTGSVPDDWLKAKRDLSRREERSLSRRQGLVTIIRLAIAAGRIAEKVTEAARIAANVGIEASKNVGRTSLRVGNKGRAAEPDADKLAKLAKKTPAERQTEADNALKAVKERQEFKDCLMNAVPEAGLPLADAVMHKSGIPDGGFKPISDPLALVVFKNEDDKGEYDEQTKKTPDHGPSHFWVTYNDAFWHENRIFPGTCQSAGQLAGQISAYAVNGGCCAFYAEDKCTAPMFTATSREDMNLKGSDNEHIRSWSCTQDPGCAGVPGMDTYAHGQCGIHVVQFQSDSKGPIAFQVDVVDALGQSIHHQERTNTQGDLLSFHVQKLNLDIKFDISEATRLNSQDGKGPADDNALISVGKDTFWSGNNKYPKPRCQFGTYDGSASHAGKRTGDCGFTCP